MQLLRYALVGVFAGLLLATPPAWAQDLITVTEAGISFAPMFENYILPVVGTAISGLIMWGIQKAAKLVNIQIDDRQRDLIHSVVDRGISAGRLWANTAMTGRLDIATQSAIARTAAGYANDRIPGALKHFKLTPQELEAIVQARMAELLAYDERTAVPAPVPPEIQPAPAPAKPARKKAA